MQLFQSRLINLPKVTDGVFSPARRSRSQRRGCPSTTQSRREAETRCGFPAHALEATLVIATAIAENNAGHPYNRLSLAESINRKPDSSAFRELLSASIAYGLTEGSEKSEQIKLTDLGKSVVMPRDEGERRKGLLEAATRVDLFFRIYRHVDGNKIASSTNLRNTLVRDFQVDACHAEACIQLLLKNGRLVGLVRKVSGDERVTISLAQQDAGTGRPTTRAQSDIDTPEEPESDDEQTDLDSGSALPVRVPTNTRPENVRTSSEPTRVFISHSKNVDIVDQIKTMLELADLPSELAVEEETTAIPVPDKVLAAMRRCHAAVICVAADEEAHDEDGTYSINQNVLIEIGPAFVLYDKRVVLVWDRRLPVPSNLQGLYRCSFEGNELSWSEGIRLMKAVNKFKDSPS